MKYILLFPVILGASVLAAPAVTTGTSTSSAVATGTSTSSAAAEPTRPFGSDNRDFVAQRECSSYCKTNGGCQRFSYPKVVAEGTEQTYTFVCKDGTSNDPDSETPDPRTGTKEDEVDAACGEFCGEKGGCEEFSWSLDHPELPPWFTCRDGTNNDEGHPFPSNSTEPYVPPSGPPAEAAPVTPAPIAALAKRTFRVVGESDISKRDSILKREPRRGRKKCSKGGKKTTTTTTTTTTNSRKGGSNNNNKNNEKNQTQTQGNSYTSNDDYNQTPSETNTSNNNNDYNTSNTGNTSNNSGSTAPDTGDGEWVDESKFRDQMLKAHNDARAKHGSAPVQWSSTIVNWAKQNSKFRTCTYAHSGVSYKSDYAENIGYNTRWDPYSFVMNQWYTNELEGFPWSSPRFIDGYGHMTVVVWRETTHIGCVIKKCGRKYLFGCNYNPPGNFGNRANYAANVKPPGSY